MELIPAIDLRGGRCVRLLRGDFAAETVYADDPLEVAAQYRALGARRVHLVDLDGARDGAQANRAVIRRLLAAFDFQWQVGGGVRVLADVRALLDAGAARVVVGSIAVAVPEELLRWADDVGAGAFVLAFDVRLDAQGIPRLATHGWREQTARTLWEALDAYATHGFIDVLCTDVARDGALEGPNDALYAQAGQRYPRLRWQASGGVRDARDLARLRACGVAAAICGRALLEQRIDVKELRPYLPNASSPVST
jgi:phosphoribosylformimino-5-aminoimidazole carboxamide ribotide isomerase